MTELWPYLITLLFLLFCNRDLSLPVICGCPTGFESYFGSFAGRVFHLLRSIPPAEAVASGGVTGEQESSG